MKSKLIEIKLYFPKISKKNTNKQMLVDLIMEAMQKDGSIEYAGYLKKKDLRADLLKHIGNGDITQYNPLSTKQKKIIKKTIFSIANKCNKKLPIPIKNFVFVFPWFPGKDDQVFKGSFGFAAYSCVLHLFISPQKFTPESLSDSLAHELNHTVSFYHHFDRYGNWSLLDHITNEGLAENFREEILKNKPSQWSISLTKKDSFKILKEIEPLLHSKDHHLHKEILFGNTKYKRWTGYSIGYWLIKEFRKKNKKLSWEDTIKMEPKDILKSVLKKEV